MRSATKGFVFAVGCMFGVALVATCGAGGGRFPGAGAMAGLFDLGGPSDARAAGPAMQLPCDKSFTRKFTYQGGSQTNTYYFADVALPGLDPAAAPNLIAYVCEQECIGGPCGIGGACPANVTCTDTGTPFPSLACTPTSPSIENGRALIYCGSVNRIEPDGKPPMESGTRWQKVYLRVE